MLHSLTFRIRALATIIIAALVGVLFALDASGRQTSAAISWVKHTEQVIETVNRTTLSLYAAESGQRGYILSRNATFASELQRNVAAASRETAGLIELTSDNPLQQERARQFSDLVSQRVDTLRINFDKARQGDFAGAAAGIANGPGRDLMSRIDVQARAILGDEQKLMAARASRLDNLVIYMRDLMLIGGGCVVLLLVAFVKLTTSQVNRPIRTIIAAMESVSAGETEHATIEARQGTREFSRLAKGYNAMVKSLEANASMRREVEAQLQASLAELKWVADDAAHRGDAIERLAGMAHRMQAARNDEEMALIIGCFVPQVLPGSSGALYAFNNSRNMLVSVAGWGGSQAAEVMPSFTPHACWGLRRGQGHTVADHHHDIVCEHMTPAGIPYHCEPLLAGGDVIGLLQFDGVVAERDRFVLTALAENIASALLNQRLQRGLREQTIRDPLTALHNRRYMEEALAIEIARTSRNGAPLAVVMCDVDHFKRFNDEFGHSAGDAKLQAVAAEMARHFRDGDVVCRYGGEEFAIIAPNAMVTALAERVEALRLAISRMNIRDGSRSLGSVSMSFGIAQWKSEFGTDADALIRQADTALYRAKAEGRNRTVIEESLAA